MASSAPLHISASTRHICCDIEHILHSFTMATQRWQHQAIDRQFWNILQFALKESSSRVPVNWKSMFGVSLNDSTSRKRCNLQYHGIRV